MTLDRAFEELTDGERFATGGRTLTEADVVLFAGLSGDTHPQHTDAEWSARSRFGERIAHGMLVLSYAVGLVPFDPERILALRSVRDAVFKRPVRLGETISADGSVLALQPLDDRAGLVTLGLRIVNGDHRLVCRASVEVLWKRDHAALGDPFEATEDGFVPIPL